MIFTIRKQDKLTIKDKNETIFIIKKELLNKFNSNLLGLGDITCKSSQLEAVVCALDLAGFTNFCNQVDPYLSIPLFLNTFLNWFYSEIKKESINKNYNEGSSLYTDLPILTKFLGDGLLIIWDAKDWNDIKINNLVTIMQIIHNRYKMKFLPDIQSKVVNPPNILRCGIARGNIYSVGNGNDFVGPSINIASRLQKTENYTFAVSKRGFELEKNKYLERDFKIIKIDIAGIGKNELIYVLKNEFDKLNIK